MLLRACLYVLDVKSALAYSVTPIVCRERNRELNGSVTLSRWIRGGARSRTLVPNS